MKPKHTPTPWVVDTQDGAFAHIRPRFGSDGFAGAESVNREIYAPLAKVMLTGDDFSPANAERIVACVNACEGINPEAVPEMLAALKQLAARFPLEFKTMLEPQPHEYQCMCNQYVDNGECRHVDALNAIAKAEGRQP